MNLTVVSDTHLQHDLTGLPSGDVLVHAGDGLNSGSAADWGRFKQHLIKASKGFKRTIYVPGNHDHFVENNEFMVKGELFAEGINLLVDEEITIDGKRIYGSPWTPLFGPWAYMRARGEQLNRYWQQIPEGLDVLVLHGPPLGILDWVPGGDHVGCWDLKERLFSMKNPPSNVIFGHIHHCANKKIQHLINDKLVTFYNVAICTESYDPANEPTVIHI